MKNEDIKQTTVPISYNSEKLKRKLENPETHCKNNKRLEESCQSWEIWINQEISGKL